jgi:hypothetical protein
MFKLKIKIILKTGAEISFRAKKFKFHMTKTEFVILKNIDSDFVELGYVTGEVAACIVRKWWQPWG